MLSYLTHDVEGVLVITCEDGGTGGEEQRATPREHLYAAIQTREDRRFAVDMSALDYLSSADVGILITIKRRVDARNGKLVLFQVQPFVHDVLKTMKLVQFFKIAEDWTEAIAILSA